MVVRPDRSVRLGRRGLRASRVLFQGGGLGGTDATRPPRRAERPLGGEGPRPAAARAAEYPAEADGDRPTDDRPDEVHPPRGPVVEHEGRTEGAGRVHRGAAYERGPEPGQDDVAAHADGGNRSELL